MKPRKAPRILNAVLYMVVFVVSFGFVRLGRKVVEDE